MQPPERNISLKVQKVSKSIKKYICLIPVKKTTCLFFEPLPEETQTIHLLSPTNYEGNTYDISLIPQKGKNTPPLAAVKGNWFKTDGSGQWEYGILRFNHDHE